ncbi:MAG: tetratricopeptide repeat protein, partial [Spartobacteria bacterium]|nr:tetratricopeptide repeat protein [Spartobacteria bacterium]
MTKIRFQSLLAAGLLCLNGNLLAEDASNVFLQAYQEFQAGEKCERDSQNRDALNRYTTALKTLEQLQKTDPTWQENVVAYRLRKARESIERLRLVIANTPTASETVIAQLPSKGFDIDIPEPLVNTRPSDERPQPDLASKASSSPLLEMQRALKASRKEVDRLERQLQDQLERSNGQLANAKMEVEKTKTELVEYKSKLAQAEDSLSNATRDRDKFKSMATAPEKRFEQLSTRITQLESEKEALQEENDRIAAKLDSAATYVQSSKAALSDSEADRKSLARERDQAVARTKRIKDNDSEVERLNEQMAQMKKEFQIDKSALESQLAEQKPKLDQLAKIVADNKVLAAKLNNAEKILAEGSKTDSQQAMLEMASQMDSLKKNVETLQSELTARNAKIQGLVANLSEATAESNRLKLDPKPNEEQKRLTDENELLRNIVLRQLKEVNERQSAATDLERQLLELEVKSESVLDRIADVKAPLSPLSDEEKLLFKDPAVFLSAPNSNSLSVSMVVVKQTDPSQKSATPESVSQSTSVSDDVETLDPKARELADLAAELYKDKRYFDAVIIYRRALQAAPDNLFVVANLAIAKIQVGKIRDAQAGLEKVRAQKPKDLLVLTNLAIVYSKLKDFDKAIETLNEILSLDPKNAVAHNYMAIVLGKTGKFKESEDYFLRSIALDPSYAKAHFNLAVMYIAQTPPSLDLARASYEKAKALGADPDEVLERRLNPTPSTTPS